MQTIAQMLEARGMERGLQQGRHRAADAPESGPAGDAASEAWTAEGW